MKAKKLLLIFLATVVCALVLSAVVAIGAVNFKAYEDKSILEVIFGTNQVDPKKAYETPINEQKADIADNLVKTLAFLGNLASAKIGVDNLRNEVRIQLKKMMIIPRKIGLENMANGTDTCLGKNEEAVSSYRSLLKLLQMLP